MGINILESGALAKPEKLIVDKAILNHIEFLYIIYNHPTCFSYKVAYKHINMHTDTNETFRTERGENNIPTEVSQCGAVVDDVVWSIKNRLLGDSLGKDGGLCDVKLQASILPEDPL